MESLPLAPVLWSRPTTTAAIRSAYTPPDTKIRPQFFCLQINMLTLKAAEAGSNVHGISCAVADCMMARATTLSLASASVQLLLQSGGEIVTKLARNVLIGPEFAYAVGTPVMLGTVHAD